MKIFFFLMASLCCALSFAKEKKGVPFFTNYTAATYGAHNRNFDVLTDTTGVVFFANFEGLLYYDNDRWRILRTPGYSRVTRLFRDSYGKLWAAGYNFLARIQTSSNGNLSLKTLASDTCAFRIGEIVSLYGHGRHIRLTNTRGEVYEADEKSITRIDSLRISSGIRSATLRVSGIGQIDISDSLSLGYGLTAFATRRHGIVVTGSCGETVYNLSESDGLCSNSISALASDGRGSVWGVTDNGICRIFLPSMFSNYTIAQGLKGEVTTIQRYHGTLYIGTLQGLYRIENGHVHPVAGISQACWKLQLSSDTDTLYAATTEGVFAIRPDGTVRLTDEYAQTLCYSNGFIYIAGLDALYRLSVATGKCIRIADISKVVSLWSDSQSSILARDIDGRIYRKNHSRSDFVPDDKPHTRVIGLPYFTSKTGWHTGIDGKGLFHVPPPDSPVTDSLSARLLPMSDITIRALYAEGDSILWTGGDFGLIRSGLKQTDAAFGHLPKVRIREVRLDADSIHFGGMYLSDRNNSDAISSSVFAPATREVSFRFSADAAAPLNKVSYQYMLRGYDDDWSTWTSDTHKSYANLFYGSYTFMVKARDAFGRITPPATYSFSIAWPFYLRWYSLVFYAVLFVLFVWLVIRWRLHSLIHEKERLEGIVRERTLLIRGQKEEIERKSANLEQALSDLRHAQENLLRQEKMATIGKLTRGLIDRILNPLNYINNFSHLSAGLVGDLRSNLSKAEDSMSPDDYADSSDILDMLSSNLGKIESHGTNTSRIIKAMEEILKDTNCPYQPTDITSLCRQSVALLHKYYSDEITRMRVSVQVSLPDSENIVQGNAVQLGKTLMSLVHNAMYAVARKYDRMPYQPVISLSLTSGDDNSCIRLRDNGTGIEQPVISRVFDPFFTTKTTAEAAGVGLYLSREIIIAHGGSISVESSKDEFTEFTIVLPLYKNNLENE